MIEGVLMENSVVVEKNGSIATIFLNEPDSLNALSLGIRKGLFNALMDADLDEEIRVVVLAGKGRAFCSGGDIRMMESNLSTIEGKKTMETIVKCIDMMQKMKKPIIAAVHGYALGAGFSLALASDLVIADEDTQFTLAFNKLGLIPDLGAHYFLSRMIGTWKTKQLIWSGAKITTKEAEQYGFVTKVVPKGKAYEDALELAAEIAEGPIQAYYQTKKIVNQSLTSSLAEVLDLEMYAQTILKETEDHREGIQAFREKRTPDFAGK